MFIKDLTEASAAARNNTKAMKICMVKWHPKETWGRQQQLLLLIIVDSMITGHKLIPEGIALP
jgi:hypothetical protein